MIVGTDQQVDVVAAEVVVSADGVGTDLLECVTEVRLAVGVLDGGGDVDCGHGRAPGDDAATWRARRSNARCRCDSETQSLPEERGGGTHERPEPRGPGRYPGITRIETPASGAPHSIGGVGGRERRSDANERRTTITRARELRVRLEANAMRAERSRQAVRNGRQGWVFGTFNREPRCLSTQQ